MHACLVTQSCPVLCNPMDCSLPGSSVLGILQARILEWVAIPFSRGSSQPQESDPHLLQQVFIIKFFHELSSAQSWSDFSVDDISGKFHLSCTVLFTSTVTNKDSSTCMVSFGLCGAIKCRSELHKEDTRQSVTKLHSVAFATCTLYHNMIYYVRRKNRISL